MFRDAITSSAPNALPLWNVTPLRRLNVQVFASADASQLSASSPLSEPSAAISVRQSKTAPCAITIMKLSECVRPSQLSDVFAPARPRRNVPPFFGVACAAADAVLTVAATRPAAAPALRTPRRFILNVILYSLVVDSVLERPAIEKGMVPYPNSSLSRDYIFALAASPMLSTPRSLSRFVSQSGSISGTEDSNKSV